MKDFNTYQLGLEKSLKDKLSFITRVNLKSYDYIVDFGCGTGALLGEIKRLVGEKTQLIGYDINPLMLSVCRERYPNIIFTSKLDDLLVAKDKKSLIIFSTVLHEIGENMQMEITRDIMPIFHTVAIRDMKRPLNNEPISNVTRRRVLAQVAPWQAKMFESKWGKIRDKENLYRFFLMNEFVENFETEVEEDYFGVNWSEIHWSLEGVGYQAYYERSYTLPYRRTQVAKRFKHTMQDITHKELIMMKKGK